MRAEIGYRMAVWDAKSSLSGKSVQWMDQIDPRIELLLTTLLFLLLVPSNV